MSKIISLIVVSVMITGCSNIRAVGDIEALNGTALEPARQTINTADKVLNMTGNYRNSSRTDQINRAYGHAKRLNPTSIPSTIQQVNDLGKYIDGY